MSNRFALFVDAGYLLAQGGDLCCGTKKRAVLSCNYEAVTTALVQQAAAHSTFHLPTGLLRVYWYDAAPRGGPTPDQQRIGNLAKVKIRLGRLSGGNQKGVDALIYRDFMTLARERAMTTAYLLAGDEDLREGVVAAQDMGVVVVLLGIPGAKPNQSPDLIREADEHIVLPISFWLPHFSRAVVVPITPAGTPVAAPSAPALPDALAAPFLLAPSAAPTPSADTAAAAPITMLPPTSATAATPAPTLPSLGDARRAGTSFAAAWVAKAAHADVSAILLGAPVIPQHLDVQLLVAGEQVLGDLRGRTNLRHALRAGFWTEFRARAKEIVVAKPSTPPPSCDGSETK